MQQVIIPVIAIDGPSGVGKGTLCQALAQHLGWHLLDSGAIYRVLALSALNHGIELNDDAKLVKLALALPLKFEPLALGVNIVLDNKNVSSAIRAEAVGIAASRIATLGSVREALLQKQRDFRQLPGLIADGRDMGTIVFTDAPVKIFLDASPQARAERRMKQLQEKGNCAKFGEVLQDIVERDYRDRHRAIAPLKPATDAHIIDSTYLSVSQVFDEALVLIKNRIN